MSARKSRIWQSFDNFDLTMKDRLNLISAYNEWVQSYIDEGWSAFLMTFMFRPLSGTAFFKIQQMKKEIEHFYSDKLLHRIIRRPKFNGDAPVLFAFPDLPVRKKDKTSTIDAIVNDGLHFHTILLIPPRSRLSVPLDLYVASIPEIYLRQRKLDRIDIQSFYTENSFRVVDYCMKSLKGRLDYDNCILILPKSSSECRDDVCQRERGVEGRRKSSMRSKKGRP
jgi:hypothetical protein